MSVYFRWRLYVSTMSCAATDMQSTGGLLFIQFSEEFYNFGYTKMSQKVSGKTIIKGDKNQHSKHTSI